MKKFVLGLAGIILAGLYYIPVSATGYTEIGQFGRPGAIAEENDGELELLARLVEAEAGNQDFKGKCLVADVVLNRVESDQFPDTITEVIFQEGQFSVVENGELEKAAYNMKESDYDAVMYELALHENKDVLYFNNCSNVFGTGKLFKVGDHYFREG